MGWIRRVRRRKQDPAPALPAWATTEPLRRFVQEGDVPGYFGHHDVLVWDAFLEFQASEGIQGHMLEIGVLQGRSALFSSLYAGPDDHCYFLDIEIDPTFRRTMEARLPETAHFLERSSFEVREEPDAYLAHTGGFRWIHVDGQHTALAVLNDLALADRLLAPRGLVSVDDFLSPMWPHVAAGVFRTLHANPGKLELFLTAFNKGYLARPEAADLYRAFVRDGLATHFASRNHDDWTVVENRVLDADEGIECLGMNHRFEGRPYLTFDNRISRARQDPA